MNYEARKIRLTCGEYTVRDWAAFMLCRLDEVAFALRQEGVRHEMWFLGADDKSLFVIGVMDVDDKAGSVAVSETSHLSVDIAHRQFKTHWDRSSIEDLKIEPRHAPIFDHCELLFEARGVPIIPPRSFETPRLILRAARAKDAHALFEEYAGRDDAALYLQRLPHRSPAQTLEVIAAWGEASWQEANRFAWTLLRRSNERPIGLFLMFIENNVAEIHYGIGSAYWGRGLATEAGIAIMDWM